MSAANKFERALRTKNTPKYKILKFFMINN